MHGAMVRACRDAPTACGEHAQSRAHESVGAANCRGIASLAVQPLRRTTGRLTTLLQTSLTARAPRTQLTRPVTDLEFQRCALRQVPLEANRAD